MTRSDICDGAMYDHQMCVYAPLSVRQLILWSFFPAQETHSREVTENESICALAAEIIQVHNEFSGTNLFDDELSLLKKWKMNKYTR